MLEGFQESFREEAYELLETLEQSLLRLEDEPDNRDVISAVFRAMHTIKGSAAMFGFQDVSDFAHHIENVLDDVRSGKIPVTKNLVDVTLASRDHIRNMLDDPEDAELPQSAQELLRRLRAVVARGTSEEGADDAKEVGLPEKSRTEERKVPAGESVPRAWHIRFVPHNDILTNGTNPILLLQELHELGDCTVVAGTDNIPALDLLEPTNSYTAWDIFLTTDKPAEAIRDVFMFVDEQCELSIRLIDEIDLSEEPRHRLLGQILVDRGVVEAEIVERAVAEQKRLGEVLIHSGIAAYEVKSALQEQEHLRRSRQKIQNETASSTIRVGSDKLDDLVDLVGELVTLQARLNQVTSSSTSGELGTISENFDRLIGELRDHTMSIRMVPIANSFSRFRRLVRDLSQELGKQVELVTQGGETELDKTVIERLHDPLVHVIRNSIDHGLERPDARTAAGKPTSGTVTLQARHVGANVEVRVTDDGRGLDSEKIRRRAVERGLVSSEAALSESDIFDLVFAPGFSTAAEVTTVSGRGVGMDVVRKEVEGIGGSVRLESRPGSGTAVIITIPLTLAIIDGLLVRVETDHFVIPLTNVQECISYRRGAKMTGTVANRGALLPIVDLRAEFSIAGQPPGNEQAVVVDTSIGPIGIVVDTVIGDHQTVIKNLGKLYNDIHGVSGATILGDGGVALILDTHRLAATTGISSGGNHT